MRDVPGAVRRIDKLRRTTIRNQKKMLIELPLIKLEPHPLNREFAREGRRWDEFVESIRRPGRILVELKVRRLANEKYQILSGHRRRSGALSLGMSYAPCSVVEMDDQEALEFLVNENMQREDLTAVDEARFVRAMGEELALTDGEIAQRVSRGVEWVRTRQGLLDLGEEVLAAVLLPKADPGHLSIGAVAEILRVPEGLRPEAVQLVLHPDLELGALNENQAREVLRRCLVEPRQREQEWEEKREPLRKAWRKQLKELLPPEMRGELAVQCLPAGGAADAARGCDDAEGLVPAGELTEAAPPGLRWVQLAVRHGLAVQVVRSEVGAAEESRAVVNTALLRQAEEARAEHGGEAWLLGRKRGALLTVVPDPPEEDAAVARAKAALDGEPDPEWNDEPSALVVIDQKMESFAWVDLGPVRELRERAARGIGTEEMRRWPWVAHCDEGVAADVCDWVLSLKR